MRSGKRPLSVRRLLRISREHGWPSISIKRSRRWCWQSSDTERNTGKQHAQNEKITTPRRQHSGLWKQQHKMLTSNSAAHPSQQTLQQQTPARPSGRSGGWASDQQLRLKHEAVASCRIRNSTCKRNRDVPEARTKSTKMRAPRLLQRAIRRSVSSSAWPYSPTNSQIVCGRMDLAHRSPYPSPARAGRCASMPFMNGSARRRACYGRARRPGLCVQKRLGQDARNRALGGNPQCYRPLKVCRTARAPHNCVYYLMFSQS